VLAGLGPLPAHPGEPEEQAQGMVCCQVPESRPGVPAETRRQARVRAQELPAAVPAQAVVPAQMEVQPAATVPALELQRGSLEDFRTSRPTRQTLPQPDPTTECDSCQS